ncbi:hypothetical protein, partial [Escherichia coli]|uniref:hypothetical protein n=1 Tax=Escherichia coli TaxID=562 RepID=UPI001BDBF273
FYCINSSEKLHTHSPEVIKNNKKVKNPIIRLFNETLSTGNHLLASSLPNDIIEQILTHRKWNGRLPANLVTPGVWYISNNNQYISMHLFFTTRFF